MKLCGRFSLRESISCTAIGDFLFSFASLILHLTEFFIIPSSHQIQNLNATIPENISDQQILENAGSILCWIYVGLNVANILMAAFLYQALIKESILKTVTFIVVSAFLILIGFASFFYHLSMAQINGHYFGFGFHALVIYPFYYFYKILALFLVFKFLKELRLSPPQRRRKQKLKKGYEHIEGSLQNLTPINERDEEVLMIEPELLKLDHQTLIGFDDHHSIIKGFLCGEGGMREEVAVKTLKVTTPTVPHSDKLMAEARLLTLVAVGGNKNILKFHGICCKPNLKDKLFLVTEFYHWGTLEDFFKEFRETHRAKSFRNLVDVNTGNIVLNSESHELPNFDTFDMLHWTHQLASGLEHLHEKRIIHGCLQSSSAVVMSPDRIKIYDLSFASKLLSLGYSLTRDELPNRFPWRWTPPEIMTSELLQFTKKSDVWSYGVTIWEIFSLGEVPYGNWERDIVKNLKDGIRLDQPQFCPKQVYEIVKSCWNQDPNERPNFHVIKLFLQQLLKS